MLSSLFSFPCMYYYLSLYASVTELKSLNNTHLLSQCPWLRRWDTAYWLLCSRLTSLQPRGPLWPQSHLRLPRRRAHFLFTWAGAAFSSWGVAGGRGCVACWLPAGRHRPCQAELTAGQAASSKPAGSGPARRASGRARGVGRVPRLDGDPGPPGPRPPPTAPRPRRGGRAGAWTGGGGGRPRGGSVRRAAQARSASRAFSSLLFLMLSVIYILTFLHSHTSSTAS